MTSSGERRHDAIVEFDGVAAEYAQAALEVLTAHDVLEQIPLVKTALAGMRIVQSVRDSILLRKLEIFWSRLSEVPEAHRLQMIAELKADPAFAENVGEHLIELLDRIDGRRKPAMVGAAFAALADHRINRWMLCRLNNAIERLPAMDIDSLRRTGLGTPQSFMQASDVDRELEFESTQALVGAGLLTVGAGYGGNTYSITKTGMGFLELELDRVVPG